MTKRRRASKQFPGKAPRRPTDQSGATGAPSAQAAPLRAAVTTPGQAVPIKPIEPSGSASPRGGVPASPLFDLLTMPLSAGNPNLAPEDPPQKEAPRVPMEYRAQVDGRCQRQYIRRPNQPPPGWRIDAQRWIDEWLERVDQRHQIGRAHV